MFDLDTLASMNERAEQEAREAHKKKAATSPLLTLADRLLARSLPSLSALIARIGQAESYAEFIELVKAYLPERAQDILHQRTPQLQIAEFASRFEDRYFPLDDAFKIGDMQSYEDITYRIPVIVMGLSYDDYHEVTEWRPAAMLLTYLIESPWNEHDDNVALAEACAEHVPQELVQRAGETRLSPEEAHRLLNGTRYEPLASWADRLHYCTNNFFLDTDYETLMNSELPDWMPENVAELTGLWQQAEALEQTWDDFMDWLEVDLPGRFEEIVASIAERRANGEEAPA
jgi:hypothetical protein